MSRAGRRTTPNHATPRRYPPASRTVPDPASPEARGAGRRAGAGVPAPPGDPALRAGRAATRCARGDGALRGIGAPCKHRSKRASAEPGAPMHPCPAARSAPALVCDRTVSPRSAQRHASTHDARSAPERWRRATTRAALRTRADTESRRSAERAARIRGSDDARSATRSARIREREKFHARRSYAPAARRATSDDAGPEECKQSQEYVQRTLFLFPETGIRKY